MKEYHTTQDGQRIKICDMDDRHLLNTIRYLQRKAVLGVIKQQGGGDTAEDFWYEEEHVTGAAALRLLNYEAFAREARRRNLPIPEDRRETPQKRKEP